MTEPTDLPQDGQNEQSQGLFDEKGQTEQLKGNEAWRQTIRQYPVGMDEDPEPIQELIKDDLKVWGTKVDPADNEEKLNFNQVGSEGQDNYGFKVIDAKDFLQKCNAKTDEEIEHIAIVTHQANKAWCRANGDNSQKDWAFAQDWQRKSAIAGVKYRLQNPFAPASAQHEAWLEDKVKDGWIYGETKDEVAKTHPCLVPYDQLPDFQKKKDALFTSIVLALV